MSTTSDASPVIVRCSFCHKSHTEVKKVVAGDGVFICDECVALSAQIIAGELGPAAS